MNDRTPPFPAAPSLRTLGALLLFAALVLFGCVNRPGAPDSGPLAAQVPAASGPADAPRLALEYHALISTLDPAELERERAALNIAPDTPLVLVRQAMLLSHPRSVANLPRAQALLDAVLAQTSADATALHPLARLLADQLAERRQAAAAVERLGLQLERTGEQLKESERHSEALQAKLDALAEIERTLPVRPPAAAPSAPPAPERRTR